MEDNRAFNYYNRFDDYLKGALDPAERKKLEEELFNDSELQKEFELYKMSIDVVQLASMKNAVEEAQRRFTHYEASLAPTVTTSARTWALRVAAGLLLLMVSYGVLQFALVSSGSLYQSLYTAYQLPVTRGYQLNYTHLDSLYLHQDYDTVLAQYEKLTKKTVRDHFIAAMAAMELGQYSAAIDRFKEVRKQNQGEVRYFEQETDYYLALCYLKNEDLKQALYSLQKIKENESHLYHTAVSSETIIKLQVLLWKQ